MAELGELSPVFLTGFVAERPRAGLAKTPVRQGCSVLREFLRYARREGLMWRDLASAVEWPQIYRLADIPQSVSWEEVGQVLGAIDTRTPCRKRDHAILLLLVTYGLRGREVAALTLHNIDWKRERLAVPERKAGHSTAFPLSAPVGEALASYRRIPRRVGRPGPQGGAVGSVADPQRCGHRPSNPDGRAHLARVRDAQAWLATALIAASLLCWRRLLALDGPLARAEPKILR